MIIRTRNWIIDTKEVVAVRIKFTEIEFHYSGGKTIVIPIPQEYSGGDKEKQELIEKLIPLIRSDGHITIDDLLIACGYTKKKRSHRAQSTKE